MPDVTFDPFDKDAEPFVEVNSKRRYGRYSDLLGVGVAKKVYHTFDQEDGIEVAWNQVQLRMFFDDEAMMECTFNETKLLRAMNYEIILECYNGWLDEE
ncbi:hypothetical protein GIB67_001323 [Kingdonia uniflora]|uniref:non-specific serine/threonine protein kinase n=1 Tax=Kingdonia uniflora TaxID=39325 RepID=A0A7J7LLD2_9MAGN|nr:hypothetical protein GIB67_001323 [Kingdonia uniflora]